MKPAPFEYHAPTTVDEASADARRARRRRQGARRRPEPRADAQPAAGPLRPPRRHRPRRRAARRSNGVNGSLVVGAATPRRGHRARPDVAADVPLLAAVTPLHRPLPDPQPGHDRRLAGPRRPGRRVPGGGARARRHVRAVVVDRGAPDRAGRRLLHRRLVDRPGAGRAADGRSRFPVWSGRCGFGVAEFARRHGDFAIAGAVAGGAARRRPTSITRCAIAVFGVGGTPCGPRRRGGALAGRAGRRRRRRGRPSWRSTAIDDVADDPQVPAAYRRGSARRWSPTPGGGPSSDASEGATHDELRSMTRRADRQRRRPPR